MIEFLTNNSLLLTCINIGVTLIAITIGIKSFLRSNNNKMDILELKNNIKNQNNFTGFKDCTDIKDSKAEQINVNR